MSKDKECVPEEFLEAHECEQSLNDFHEALKKFSDVAAQELGIYKALDYLARLLDD